MLTYRQNDGEFYIGDHFEGIGYSGFGNGRNNPAMESARSIGPIPVGLYRITESDPSEHSHLAPPVFRLDPTAHDAHGRTGFLIHGNNKTNDASHGCIVLGKSVRARIRASHETSLEVVVVGDTRMAEVPQPKPLMQSRTMQAGTVAGASTTIYGIVDQLKDAQDTLSSFSYTRIAQIALIAVTLLSLGVVFYARWDDHRRGLR